MKKLLFPIIFLSILLLFLYTRFYKLTSSFEFFNDMGRDLLVLLDWQRSGKPPLLGPQNSALPFNQSALYFYLIFPFFLLFRGSLFTAVVVNAVMYLLPFVVGVYVLRNKSFQLQWIFCVLAFFAVIHPIVIIQNRFIWNPSFVLPALLISVVSLLFLHQKWSRRLLWSCAGGLAFAFTMSYSAVLALFGFFFAAFVLFKKKAWQLGAITVGLIGLLNLPTVFFELRHKFLLTSMLFTREPMPQVRTGLVEKLQDLFTYMLPTGGSFVRVFLLALFVTFCALGMYFHLRVKKNEPFFIAILVFLGTLGTTLISPVNIQAHYVFPLLAGAFFVLATLPFRLSLLACVVFGVLWLNPAQIATYSKPAMRTASQLESCVTKVCSSEKEPMFVSVQAGYQPYHTGPEYRYLLKRAGCAVEDIETQPEAAKRMAVVVDNSTYEHGKTAYNELTLFGESQVDTQYSCEGNIQVVVLAK